MKKLLVFSLTFVLLLLSAKTILSGVSPNILEENYGYLIVHTDQYEKYEGDYSWKVYKGYSISDISGKLRKEISISFENPVKIRLKPGMYIIKAIFPGKVDMRLVVTVEQGKITEILK